MTTRPINEVFVNDKEKLFMIFDKNLQKYVIHISEAEFISCMRVYQEDNADVYSKTYGEENR